MTSILAYALSLAPLAQEHAAAPIADVLPQVEAMAREIVDAGYARALVVGLLRGEERALRGFGRLRPGEDAAPDADSVFEIGSVSKVFTGLLLADAVGRGLAELESPAAELAPEDAVLPAFEDEPIRLVHLATHTSGLPRLPVNFQPANHDDPYADYEFEHLWAGLAELELRRRPGEAYAYSNLGAGLLGALLAHTSETSYAELVRTRIAEPLGLADTRVDLTESMRARLAPGCDVDGRPRASWHAPALAGAGMIRSTVGDLLTFAAAQIDPPDDELGRAIALSQAPQHHDASGVVMGLGWHLASGGATLWHNGQTGGYHAFLAVWPAGEAAVAVLATTTSDRIDLLGDNALRLFMGAGARPLELRSGIELEGEILARYTGNYRLAPLASVTITLEDGSLWAQLTGQEALRLYPASAERFFYRAVDAEIVFELDDQGRSTALVLHQHGRELPAKRID